jgi:MarR family transcriptional regulator for hemolysin
MPFDKPRSLRSNKNKRSKAARAADGSGRGAAQDEARWMPEVSPTGELFLRRREGTEAGIPQDMSYPFSQGLTFVARRWRNLMNEELRAVGQSQARWGILYWITVFGDTVNQTELADRIGVEQPTLGRVLRDLESEGLITRSTGDDDRRAKVIRLTTAATPLMRQINRIQTAVRKRLLEGIPPKDLEMCMAVFARILSNMDRH